MIKLDDFNQNMQFRIIQVSYDKNEFIICAHVLFNSLNMLSSVDPVSFNNFNNTLEHVRPPI